jgi:hypothetical protein
MKSLASWSLCAVVTVTMLVLGASGQTKANAVAPARSSEKQATEMASGEELFRTIEKLDTEVFTAYNNCDLATFGSFFPEQLEFYHDNGGLVASTREQLVGLIKQNICGKVRRELVKGSLEVFPMKGYGALEMGRHRFTHPGIDNDEGEGSFIQLWKYEDGKWVLTRVISYNHHGVGKK